MAKKSFQNTNHPFAWPRSYIKDMWGVVTQPFFKTDKLAESFKYIALFKALNKWKIQIRFVSNPIKLISSRRKLANGKTLIFLSLHIFLKE